MSELFNHEAERAVLSAFARMSLGDPAQAKRELDASGLDAGHFTHQAHRDVLEVMHEILAAGVGASSSALYTKLKASPAVKAAGGPAWIAELADNLHVMSHELPLFLGAVRDMAARRRVEEVARALMSSAHNLDRAPAESLRDAQSRLASIVASGKRTLKTLGDVAGECVDEMEALLQGKSNGLFPTGLAELDHAIGGGLAPILTVIGGLPGVGKALALDTPIPTPDGWTTMGALSAGDRVFAEDGKSCRVLACTEVMQGRPCYEVEFSDGARIVADAQHVWVTMTRAERMAKHARTDERRAHRRAGRVPSGKGIKPWVAKLNSERLYAHLPAPTGKARTTEEIARTLTTEGGKRLNHSIAVADALDLPEIALPIDPYVLGAWLGDGSTGRAEITGADVEIIDEIRSAGWNAEKCTWSKYAWRIGDVTHGAGQGRGWRNTFTLALKAAGVVSNKHIPQQYLRASIQQRIALLQGLMDTDGHCSAQNGRCEFTTTSPDLRDGAFELLASLGIKAKVCEGVARVNGKDCGAKWRLTFLADFPVFRLPRKALRQKRSAYRGTHDCRYITAVRPIPSVPVRCIQVDSESHCYLAGREMIPTHNSGLFASIVHSAAARGDKVGVFSLEDEAKWLGWRIFAHEARIPQPVLRGKALDKGQQKRMLAAFERIGRYASNVVIDDRCRLSGAEVAQTAHDMVLNHGCKAIIVDHLGEVRMDAKSDRYDLAVQDALFALRDVAKERGIPVILAAPLNRRKSGKPLTPQDDPVPGDIKNSSAIEYAARLILMLSRPSKDVLRIGIPKQTNGSDGFVDCRFEGFAAMVADCEGAAQRVRESGLYRDPDARDEDREEDAA